MSFLGTPYGAIVPSSGGPTHYVGTNWASLPESPSDGDRCFLRTYGIQLVYLADLGEGMWVPECLVSGDADAPTLNTDVDILLWAPAITGLANSDPVATWANLGSGGDFTAAGSARPTYSTTAGPGSTPAVDFDGTANVMSQTSPTLLNAQTNAASAVLWNPDTFNALVDNPLLEVATNGGTEERWGFQQDSALRAKGRIADTDTTEFNTAPTKAPPAIGTWIAMASTYDAANTALNSGHDSRIIGAADWTLSFGGGATVTDSTNPDHIEIGGSSNDSLFANGQMVCVCVVEGTLAANLGDDLRCELQKWLQAYAGL